METLSLEDLAKIYARLDPSSDTKYVLLEIPNHTTRAPQIQIAKDAPLGRVFANTCNNGVLAFFPRAEIQAWLEMQMEARA